MKIKSKCLSLLLAKQYSSIGGQAVIEGVMMRSPNAFVVAVRKPNGKICVRKDQWFGISKKFPIMTKPFLRGVLSLFEAMANGVVALNFSANIAMDEQLKEQAIKDGKSLSELEGQLSKDETIDWATYITIGLSFVFGMGLFVFVPHAVTEGLNNLLHFGWSLDGKSFHIVDGLIKALVFILYVKFIGLLPDIKKVFEYHGAEHKSISTFEAGEELTVENARKFSTYHPRCGTSFIFFLLLISIIIFSGVFNFVTIGEGLPPVLKHIYAVILKIALMIPIAGVAYELIKLSGKNPRNILFQIIGLPGRLLQKLTTGQPSDEQLEVALSSIKVALLIEETYKLNDKNSKVLGAERIEFDSLSQIDSANSSLKDFLER